MTASDISLSLWDFGRYVVAPYAAKAGMIRKLQEREAEGYNRAADFYRAVREGTRIVFNTDPNAPEQLLDIPQKVKNKNRREHAEVLVRSMLQAWKDRDATFFWPPSSEWTGDGVRVRVQFDLGMRTSDGSFLVRNWYYGPEPSRQLLDVCLAVMQAARFDKWRPEWVPAIWVVRRDGLETPRPGSAYGFGLAAERVSLGRMWELVEQESQQ